MNEIFYGAQEVPMPAWINETDTFIKKVLETLGHDNWELSVVFCNNRYIKSLNAQYRNKDEPTDVLSFEQGEFVEDRYLAGDIFVSLDALEENSRFFKVSADEELRRLLVHGILHLSGEDHATNKEDEPMLKKQEEILVRLAVGCIQENSL